MTIEGNHDRALLMVTSTGDAELADNIARQLVGRGQAACVNTLSGVKSTYRWQGEVCCEGEWMLIIKTLESRYDEVAATIAELHTYDLPEVLAFHVAKGDDRFLQWIADNASKESAS